MLANFEEPLVHHLESYLSAADNENLNFVYSSVEEGPHLYCYAPSKLLGRPYWTVVTMGLSNQAFPVKAGKDTTYQRNELLCYLPSNWSFPASLGQEIDERNWPMEMLRICVKSLKHADQWIFEGVTCDISAVLKSSPFSQAILMDSGVREKEGFRTCDLNHNSESVVFHAVIPLTQAELEWKEEVGLEESLFEIIGETRCADDLIIDYIINPSRKCSVTHHNAKERVAKFFESLPDEADFDEDETPYFVHSSFAELPNPTSFVPRYDSGLSVSLLASQLILPSRKRSIFEKEVPSNKHRKF